MFGFQKGDRSLLAQFFYADDELNAVAAELDSFDGKKDPQRCTALVNHLRQCQDKVRISSYIYFGIFNYIEIIKAPQICVKCVIL